MSDREQLRGIMKQVEEMWDHQDTLFRIIDVADDWDHPHGKDWTFADVTYHLAYCNRDLVARGFEYGTGPTGRGAGGIYRCRRRQ